MNASASSARLQQQLTQLEQVDLIRLATALPELEYLFRHALIQESVYETLLRADRRRVHRAAGEALETLLAGREPSADLAPQLARHFEAAGDLARALHYYTLAGDAALARYANVEAIADYTHALSAVERSPVAAHVWQHLFEARGRALELLSQFSEALRNYQAMARRAEALGDRHLALAAAVATGQLYATPTTLFDLPRAERLTAETLAEARALGDEPAEARILWHQLNMYRFSMRNQPARVVGEQSLAIARRLDLRDQAAFTVNDLIHIYASLSLWPEFRQAAAEAQQRWRDLGNAAMLADSLTTAALYRMMLGEFAEALGQAQAGHQQAAAIRNLWGQSYSLANMVWPHWYTGHPGPALEAAAECLRVGRDTWPFASSIARSWLAFMTGDLGDPAAGLELIHPAAAEAESMGGVGLSAVLAIRALLELRAGSRAEAAATLAAMERGMRQPPLLLELNMVLRARSEVALAQGEAGPALAATQAHVADLRQRGLTAYVPEALLGLAQAWLLQGRLAEARASLLEALAGAQALGAVMAEWPVCYALARLERQRADAAAAAPHWARAREIVTAVAARVPTPALRQRFLALPAPRALVSDRSPLGPESGPPAEPV